MTDEKQAVSAPSTSSGASGNVKDQEQLVQEFNGRREELRALEEKIQQLEGELQEHDLVSRTLEGLDESRKCFRLVGNVLCERNVAQVRPAVAHNREKVSCIIEAINALDDPLFNSY